MTFPYFAYGPNMRHRGKHRSGEQVSWHVVGPFWVRCVAMQR